MEFSEAVDLILKHPDVEIPDSIKDAVQRLVIGVFGPMERIAVALEAIERNTRPRP
jgi:hypothetical protein